MKRNQIVKLLVVSIAMLCSFMAFAEFEVKAEKENVVASRLIGKWQTQSSLSQRLSGHKVNKETFVFVKDNLIASYLPESYAKFLNGKRIYLAGIMTRKKKEYPFILIDYKGNPYLLYFRKKDGDFLGDVESFNLVITPAKDREKDLLFIGGDFNNQPFSAFERIK